MKKRGLVAVLGAILVAAFLSDAVPFPAAGGPPDQFRVRMAGTGTEVEAAVLKKIERVLPTSAAMVNTAIETLAQGWDGDSPGFDRRRIEGRKG